MSNVVSKFNAYGKKCLKRWKIWPLTSCFPSKQQVEQLPFLSERPSTRLKTLNDFLLCNLSVLTENVCFSHHIYSLCVGSFCRNYCTLCFSVEQLGKVLALNWICFSFSKVCDIVSNCHFNPAISGIKRGESIKPTTFLQALRLCFSLNGR